MYKFPKRPSTIKSRIKSYERDLRKEAKTFGAINDSYGKRYLLGPLYMLLGDNAGAKPVRSGHTENCWKIFRIVEYIF